LTTFQVLGDADARLNYDRSGAKATRDGGVSADSAVGLFQTVFGSADFDPLVGKFPLLEQALH